MRIVKRIATDHIIVPILDIYIIVRRVQNMHKLNIRLYLLIILLLLIKLIKSCYGAYNNGGLLHDELINFINLDQLIE